MGCVDEENTVKNEVTSVPEITLGKTVIVKTTINPTVTIIVTSTTPTEPHVESSITPPPKPTQDSTPEPIATPIPLSELIDEINKCANKTRENGKKQKCLSDLAIENNNSDICAYINESFYIKRQGMGHTSNYAHSETHSAGEIRVPCYTTIAIKLNDSSICDQIRSHYKDICKTDVKNHYKK